MKPEDKYTLGKIALLHPIIREKVLIAYRNLLEKDIAIRICQGLRTFAEQDELYAQGRTKAGGIVTQAKAGQSFHNFGLAIDFCLLLDNKEVTWDRNVDLNHDSVADWKQVVDEFKSAGFTSGGDWKNWKDYPHLEYSCGKDEKWFLDRYNAKNYIDGSTYVKIEE